MTIPRTTSMGERYVIVLQDLLADDDAPGGRRMAVLLKVALRRFGFKGLEAVEALGVEPALVGLAKVDPPPGHEPAATHGEQAGERAVPFRHGARGGGGQAEPGKDENGADVEVHSRPLLERVVP